MRFRVIAPLSIAVAAVLVVACATLAGLGDYAAGASGGTVDGAAVDTGCLTVPSTVGNEAPFCQALASYYARCGRCATCFQEDVSNCERVGDGISAIYKSAFEQCVDELDCDVGFLNAIVASPCIANVLRGFVATDAQAVARDAFCNACLDGGDCSDFFATGDGSAACFGSVPGGYVAAASDSVAQAIAQTCSGDLYCNACFYLGCSQSQFCASTGSSPCEGGICN